jgi:hypothetical protein
MAQWWESYPVAEPTSPPPARTGFIPGVPKPGQDVELERDRVALERDRNALTNDQIKAERDRIALATEKSKQAATGGVDTTEGEKTAAALTTRIQAARNDIGRALKDYPDAQSPEWDEAIASGIFGAEGEAANFLRSTGRQRVFNAELDALDAALTLGTGAAYTREQLINYRSSMFPRISDDPETIADKRRRLLTIIQSGRAKAGAAAPKIDQALAAVDALYAPIAIPKDPETDEELRARNVSEEGLSALVNPKDSPGLPVDVHGYDRLPGESDSDYVARTERLDAEYEKNRGSTVAGPSEEARGGILPAAAGGVADVLTMGLSDELAAGANTLISGGTMADNMREQRDITAYDERNYPKSRFVGQLVGGLALPGGNVRSLGGMTALGAGYGASYGFGSSDGSFGDRATGAALGGLLGAGTAGAIGALTRAPIRGTRPPGGNDPTALIAAAGRQGVELLPADVGGALTGRLTGGLKQTIFGSGPVLRGAQRVSDQVEGRIGQIAAIEGAPVRQEVLGETARDAANEFIDTSGRVGSELYREAREGSADSLLQGRSAFQNLNAQIRELGETRATSAPVINGLERLRADIADDGGLRSLSVEAMRRLRTNVRHEAQVEGLRGTDYQRRANQVLDALSEDIASQLPEEAAAAFRRADQQWRDRLEVIDEVMSEVIGQDGDRSAEKVAQRLTNMSRGDSRNFGRFLDSVGDREAGVIRASLIDELGRAAPGQQNAAGNAFSLETFLTNWNKLPERSRELLFRGESREHMQDLALIAERARASRSFTNTSSTAGATNVNQAIQNVSAIGAYSTLFGSAVAENLTGRLLASPAFARWLARPARDPGVARRRLANIASRSPELAPDISIILQAISRAANDNAGTITRAAASGDGADANRNQQDNR